jgi:hypothetical protein
MAVEVEEMIEKDETREHFGRVGELPSPMRMQKASGR